jgi:hypothetical protein
LIAIDKEEAKQSKPLSFLKKILPLWDII